MPRTNTGPSAQADDIGARFGVPSAFSVLISTTGVPTYRMLGAIVTCSVGSVCVMTSIVGGRLFGPRRTVHRA
jgi:hypothetical protein